MTNPYKPPGGRSAAGPATGSRLLKLLGSAFALYTVIGHLIFYGRVAETYGRLGPEGVHLYYASSLVLLFLSFFGAACVAATSAYTFRRARFRTVVKLLVSFTAAVLGGSVAAFFTLENYWVRSVVFFLAGS